MGAGDRNGVEEVYIRQRRLEYNGRRVWRPKHSRLESPCSFLVSTFSQGFSKTKSVNNSRPSFLTTIISSCLSSNDNAFMIRSCGSPRLIRSLFPSPSEPPSFTQPDRSRIAANSSSLTVPIEFHDSKERFARFHQAISFQYRLLSHMTRNTSSESPWRTVRSAFPGYPVAS